MEIYEVEMSDNRILTASNIDLETNKLKLDEIKYINDEVIINSKKKLKKDDILISTASGSKKHLGKVAFIESEIDFYYGGFMGVLRCDDLVFPQYLFKVLINQDFKNYLLRLNDGLDINNLKFDLIKDFLVPLPPLKIQKQIVDKIDTAFIEFDKAIAILKKKEKELIQLKISFLATQLTEIKQVQ